MPGRLVLSGGFAVDDARHRHLKQQARRLGFADLRACLGALLDDGWSVPQLAAHLGATQAAIRAAIADHHIPQPPRRQQLARQRRRAGDQRVAVRMAELGFPSVQAYLVDRLVTKAWTLAAVAAELGAASATVRRLLDHHQVRRVAATRRQRAAADAASGPQQQARACARRRARLAELGFATLEAYLQDRHVREGCSVRRLGAELGVGHRWLDQQLRRLGLRT